MGTRYMIKIVFGTSRNSVAKCSRLGKTLPDTEKGVKCWDASRQGQLCTSKNPYKIDLQH